MKPEIKIEKNVPMPARNSGITAIICKMKVGDSVVIPPESQAVWRSTARLKNINLAGRSISPTEYRMWRIK